MRSFGSVNADGFRDGDGIAGKGRNGKRSKCRSNAASGGRARVRRPADDRTCGSTRWGKRDAYSDQTRRIAGSFASRCRAGRTVERRCGGGFVELGTGGRRRRWWRCASSRSGRSHGFRERLRFRRAARCFRFGGFASCFRFGRFALAGWFVRCRDRRRLVSSACRRWFVGGCGCRFGFRGRVVDRRFGFGDGWFVFARGGLPGSCIERRFGGVRRRLIGRRRLR